MQINKIFDSVFRPEYWCCAVRFNTNEENCILNDDKTPFVVINDTKRYWTADPFLYERDGKYYLFFEAFDRLKKKGLLGYREISQDKIGEINIIYEDDTHLSYPFIYEDNGVIYIIPESSKSHQLYKIKCTSFPDKWEKEEVLLNEDVVDSIIFNYNGNRFLITEKVDSSNCFDRVDIYYENGSFKSFNNNPVKRDVNNARGAGNMFEFDGMLIRPAQNCGKSYGESLNFNKVINLDVNEFEEIKTCEISVKGVPLSSKNIYKGIHTYNKFNNVEVIDLKLPRKFSFYNFIGALNKFVKKVF